MLSVVAGIKTYRSTVWANRILHSLMESFIKTVQQPFKVSIEGNIGAGKSTLIRYFEKFPDVDAQREPISEWCNVEGHNLLELLYKDLNKYNFMFQNYVQLSRLNTQMRQTNKRVLMFERSLQNNRYCFLEMAHDNGHLSDPEYVVLCKWYEWIEKNVDIHLDLIVYLRSSPEIVYKRIQQRKRPEEKTISLDYLQNLHKFYDRWLLHSKAPAPVLVIDVDKELDQVQELYAQNQSYILGHNSTLSNTIY